MKNILILSILMLFTFYGYSQELPNVKGADIGPVVLADTSTALKLSDKAWQLVYKGKYDSAVYYFDQSLAISKKLSYRRGIINYYYSRASIFWYKGENVRAATLFEVVIQQVQKDNNRRGLIKLYGNLALLYRDMGNLPKALESSLRALRYSEALGDTVSMASCYVNIGMFRADQNEHSKALPYYEKAIAMFLKIGDTQHIGSVYSDGSAVYERLDKPEKAREYAYKGLHYSSLAQMPDVMATAHTNLGFSFLNAGLLDSSLWHLQKAMTIREELEDMEGLVPCLFNIAVIYKKTNRVAESLVYLEEAGKMAKLLHATHYTSKIEEELSTIYKEKGDYKKAYEHYTRYVAAHDSLFNQETTAKLVKSEMNYEFEKKELLAKQEQEQKNVEAATKHRRQQWIIWVVSGALLLLSVIALLVLRQFRFRNKEREMQLEQKLLRSQMNPHFIFNSLQAIQNFILKRNEKEAVRYLGSFASITRSVLENSRMELIPLRKEVSLLGNYLQLQKLRFGEKFEYDVSVDEQIDQDAVYIPPMLSQPFIENALEHGMSGIESGGFIRVNFSLKDQNLMLEISDNGYGLKTEKKEQKEHTSLATTITRERIELMNSKSKAKISFTISEAYPGDARVGLKVCFLIPLSGISI